MFKARLRIEKSGEDTQYINIEMKATSYSVGNIKNDYSVVESNRYKGISKGIGLITAGRKLQFNIPLFEISRIDEEKDIYKLISKWTSLLANSYAYTFYIEQYIDSVWYSAEIIINEVSGYTVERINLVKSFSVSYLMIDNFYSGEEIKEVCEVKGSGNMSFSYKSLSYVPVPLSFSMKINSNARTLSFQILHKDNYGIVINEYLGGGAFTIDFDGENSYKTNLSGEKSLISWEGVQPFLNVGVNDFLIISSYNITEFTAIYRKGIAI